MARIVDKEFKWKHTVNHKGTDFTPSEDSDMPGDHGFEFKPETDCCNKSNEPMEILTPYPKKRNRAERFFNRYNHILELVRTLLGCATVILQLIILYRLSN